jgi:DNA-binding PadR family transcriptional regulator
VKNISEKHIQHLMALKGGERSAYPGLHMGTLQALERKGLVTSRHGLGSMFMPRNSINWRITDAGRKALNGD